MDPFGLLSDIFFTFLITPLTNLFVLLTTLTGSAGIAVILLTILIRVGTIPMTLKQMRMTRMMAAMQPRQQEINKRYKDPKRRQQELMKLYKEAGVNPLGCFSSFFLQVPILWALYRTFILSVGEAPESLIRLSGRLYDWDYLRSGLPLPSEFLWLHLGRPDPVILPLLVAVTTFVLQKMSTLPSTDEKARAQASMMNFMMPLIFGWITLTLPSGLGLYYVLSNIIGVVMQYAYVGGGPVNYRGLIGLSQDPVLPRAIEVREKQFSQFRNLSNDDDEDDEGAAAVGAKPRKPNSPAGRSSNGETARGAQRRRRRYGRGKR
jgi:YidC/Oxa1 family membrane protein insertase